MTTELTNALDLAYTRIHAWTATLRILERDIAYHREHGEDAAFAEQVAREARGHLRLLEEEAAAIRKRRDALLTASVGLHKPRNKPRLGKSGTERRELEVSVKR